jgi:hypothetical protein
VSPPPAVRIGEEQPDGRGVLILDVLPRPGTLHALVLDRDKPEYYVRRDGTTYYAKPEELTAILTAADAPRL